MPIHAVFDSANVLGRRLSASGVLFFDDTAPSSKARSSLGGRRKVAGGKVGLSTGSFCFLEPFLFLVGQFKAAVFDSQVWDFLICQ